MGCKGNKYGGSNKSENSIYKQRIETFFSFWKEAKNRNFLYFLEIIKE